jgi:hypothetical protein
MLHLEEAREARSWSSSLCPGARLLPELRTGEGGLPSRALAGSESLRPGSEVELSTARSARSVRWTASLGAALQRSRRWTLGALGPEVAVPSVGEGEVGVGEDLPRQASVGFERFVGAASRRRKQRSARLRQGEPLLHLLLRGHLDVCAEQVRSSDRQGLTRVCRDRDRSCPFRVQIRLRQGRHGAHGFERSAGKTCQSEHRPRALRRWSGKPAGHRSRPPQRTCETTVATNRKYPMGTTGMIQNATRA